jgi:hypothetical protein
MSSSSTTAPSSPAASAPASAFARTSASTPTPTSNSTQPQPQTPKQVVAFIGASGGCGLAALRHTLAAGYTCVALCRTPSKLTDILPTATHPNLTVLPGNAHDVAAVKAVLAHPTNPSAMVDTVCFTIGSPLIMSKLTTADPDVCKNGIAAVITALAELRKEGRVGGPRIVAISTTGISKFGRDVPLAMVPMYHILLKVPHADKNVMEERLVASGEEFVFVRPSFLKDGETDKIVRVGVEDPVKGMEGGSLKEAMGYVISREDVGKWMFQHLLKAGEGKQYSGKAVMISY